MVMMSPFHDAAQHGNSFSVDETITEFPTSLILAITNVHLKTEKNEGNLTSTFHLQNFRTQFSTWKKVQREKKKRLFTETDSGNLDNISLVMTYSH